MTSVETRSRLTLSPSVGVVTILRKFIPRPLRRYEREQLRNDLARLALGAPHVLADIGFERDAGASAPARTVWRKGTLSVVIEERTPSVSVSIG